MLFHCFALRPYLQLFGLALTYFSRASLEKKFLGIFKMNILEKVKFLFTFYKSFHFFNLHFTNEDILKWRHDSQHNDTQHNITKQEIHQNESQHDNTRILSVALLTVVYGKRRVFLNN